MIDEGILWIFFFWKFMSLGEIFILYFFCFYNYFVIKLKLKNKIKFDIKNMYRVIREVGFMV